MRNRATGAQGDLAFEAYGVRLLVELDRQDLVGRIEQFLPPDRTACSARSVDKRLALTEDNGRFDVRVDGALVGSSADLDVSLEMLAGQMRAAIAVRSPSIFVHAGVVAHAGRAIVIPGPSFSGKTTLVGALVEAGGLYYSDEYAVLDDQGGVHPYAKPLSIRDPEALSGFRVSTPAGQLGGTAVPIGLIVITRYSPAATWRPERRSPGEGALALLSNTVPVRDRPAEALAAVRRAAASALVLEGDRGDAREIAAELLECCAASI